LLLRHRPVYHIGRCELPGALRCLPKTEHVDRMVEYLPGEGGCNITGKVLTIDAGDTA
jgi:hypothetical protein